MKSSMGWHALGVFWSLSWWLGAAAPAAAEDFYIDPGSGAASGDGSAQQPWQTLEAVVQAGHLGKDVKAGDTLWLRSGDHGALNLKGGNYTPSITIAAADGQTPKLSRAAFSQAHGVVLRGVSISPSYAKTPAAGDIVSVDKASSSIEIRDCELFSVSDAANWGANEWINAASSGLQISGDHVVASHNRLTNVRFGISVDGPNALIEYNQVINFSGDGMRGLGDYDVFQYNVVKNVYVDQDSGDDNHDDGFQSWSTGPDGPGSGVVTGVVLRGNYFLNREDPNQKLSNSMQGIGCFDGMFDQWVVENNVVATDHWHGISFYGMTNSRVVNNTVIDVNAASPGPPWIMVTAHKDGTASQNVIVRNNLATDYDVSGSAITQDHNATLKDLAPYFVNPGKFDLHLLPNAPAVDQGSAEQAPELDLDGIARPQGAGVDLGAYEWHAASVETAAGHGGSSGSGASGRAAANGAGGTGGRATMNTGGSGGAAAANAAARDAGRSEGDAAAMTTMMTTMTKTKSASSSGCGCSVIGVTNGTRELAGLATFAALIFARKRRRR